MSSFKSYEPYKNELDKIIELTNKPVISKQPILAPSLIQSTAVNLAVDLILKYLTYFQNPYQSTSHDSTITKDGTAIRVFRDPLEFIINYADPIFQHLAFWNSKNKSTVENNWLNFKLKWVDFLFVEIVKPMLDNDSQNISLNSLSILLADLFKCSTDTEVASKDLFSILNVVSIKNFESFRNVINPSFHHVYEAEKHFSSQADLIIDNTLLDIKNTKEIIFSMDYYRQILYYYFWSTIEIDEQFYRMNLSGSSMHLTFSKPIENIGFYYPRFDYMIKFKVDELWKNKNNQEKAKEIFLKAIKKTK